MTMDLKSTALAMPQVDGHPNRAAFNGVLTMVDVPSQRPPSGAKGHLVVLTRKAAEAALPSLLGMGVDYSPSLDRHDVRCKVGVITRAEIVGRNVELGGYLFARDFPEIVEEIAKAGGSDSPWLFKSIRAERSTEHLVQEASSTQHSNSRLTGDGQSLKSSLRAGASQLLALTEALRGKNKLDESQGIVSTICAGTRVVRESAGLGMSYEVTGVQLADRKATVWTLEKVTFTGAAILRRDKAAYNDTWIELST
jgi:hypothetical protein